MHKLTLLLLSTLLIISHSLQWYQQNNPHFITDSELQSLKATDHTTIKIIKFFTPWCRYCRFMKAHFDTYKSSHEISNNLKFYEFNCANENMRVCGSGYRISGFPTIIAYDETGKEINQISGMYPENVIMRFLDDMNNKAKVIQNNLNQKPQGNSGTPPEQTQTKQQPASNPSPTEQTPQQPQNTSPKQTSPPNPDPDTPQIKQDKVEIPTQQQQPQPEISTNEQPKKSGISISSIMKYLFYLFTAVIGGYYGLHVFQHKYENNEVRKENEETVKFVNSVQIESKNLEGVNEQELKAEDVSDENL